MAVRILSLLTLCLVLLWPTSKFAQEIAKAPKNDRIDPAVERKAFDLVEAIAAQVPSLRAPANRIRMGCAVADLVWTHDEKRARALFKAVTDEMVARINNLDLSDARQLDQELSWLQQQRQEIVNRMADRDADLALSFLRLTRLQAPESRRWYAENETNLEFQLAQRIAAKDPQRALEAGRAALAHGFSWNLSGLLATLQQKDPKVGQAFYEDVVSRIKNENLEPNRQVFGLAMSLLMSFQPPQANEDTYRDLMATMITAGLNVNPASQSSLNFVDQLKSLMPQVQKYAPDRAADLAQWSAAAERLADPAARMYREMSQLGQTGSIEDMLAAAAKYPPEFQNQLYQQAAWKAFSSGDPERARQIISEFVSDPAQKRQILDQFNYDGLNKAFNDNKLDDARQLINRIKSADQRVQMALRLANQFAGKGDKKSAIEVLNELKNFLAGFPPDSFRVSADLQLARAYANVDFEQSLATIEPLISKTNELLAAAVVLDGFDQRFLQDGEWAMSGNGLSNLVMNLEQTVASLATQDFDRAEALAARFERPEIRLMTQLQIVQSVLGRKAPSNYPMMRGAVIVFNH